MNSSRCGNKKMHCSLWLATNFTTASIFTGCLLDVFVVFALNLNTTITSVFPVNVSSPAPPLVMLNDTKPLMPRLRPNVLAPAAGLTGEFSATPADWEEPWRTLIALILYSLSQRTCKGLQNCDIQALKACAKLAILVIVKTVSELECHHSLYCFLICSSLPVR